MSWAIGGADKATILGLSRAEVEVTTASLKQFLNRSRWLGLHNRYTKDVIGRLKQDVPLSPHHSRNLAQYIAASSTLHCLDAWSYLGRAISALLRGDTHRAIHLAYYAELRATLALLATEGIGVFNKQHFVIDQKNSALKLAYTQGTHVAAWTALEFWSAQPPSGALFTQLINPGGINLESWFLPHGGAITLAAQAKSWLMQWGMDLSLAAKDREARNESSYQADGIPNVWAADSGAIVDFVSDLWYLLEPSAGSNFEQIDRHILRIALETYFTSRFGGVASHTNRSFVGLIDSTLAAQSLGSTHHLRDFLLRKSAPEDSAVFRHSATAPSQAAIDIFPILSRSVLLLRLATGSVSDQLHTAAVGSAAIKFWWEAIGETRGFWKAGSSPADLTDLWKDIEDTLSDIDSDKAHNPNGFASMFDVRSHPTVDFSPLCSPERVALWSLCSR